MVPVMLGDGWRGIGHEPLQKAFGGRFAGALRDEAFPGGAVLIRGSAHPHRFARSIAAAREKE
jgi:hypothetical protein